MKSKIQISEKAAQQISFMLSKENNTNLMFRVKVSGGGCAGFQYSFDFDDKKNDEDLIFSDKGVSVIIDDVSLDLLGGSEIDYVEDLIGSFFQIKNPNASSTCGCGTSFSL